MPCAFCAFNKESSMQSRYQTRELYRVLKNRKQAHINISEYSAKRYINQ